MKAWEYIAEEIRQKNLEEYENLILSESYILRIFKDANAYWGYEGEPCSETPHAELTSGLCSNGYFNCSKVLKDPRANEILAHQLVKKLKAEGLEKVDWVVGSPYAAITFSYEVAKAFGANHGFTEKDSRNPKKMIWKRFSIPKKAKVLQIEELITTSGTMKEVRRAVFTGNRKRVTFLPIVGSLVHRPQKLPVDYGDIKVVALVEKEIQTFEPKECPYCRVGSKRYRPKTNWRELTENFIH